MSGESVLLDSVIVIDHFNGVDAATGYLASVGRLAHVSAITRAEVLTGFVNDRDRHGARRLLDRLNFVAIDAPVADLAADLRRTEGWKLPDALQAAAALHNDLRLATRNTRDFPPDSYHYVIEPYELG